MKKHLTVIIVTSLLTAALPFIAAAQTAGQDMRKAGRETKEAARDAGKGTARAAKTTAKKTKKATKKVAHAVTPDKEDSRR